MTVSGLGIANGLVKATYGDENVGALLTIIPAQAGIQGRGDVDSRPRIKYEDMLSRE